jgi:hypothetical protein
MHAEEMRRVFRPGARRVGVEIHPRTADDDEIRASLMPEASRSLRPLPLPGAFASSLRRMLFADVGIVETCAVPTSHQVWPFGGPALIGSTFMTMTLVLLDALARLNASPSSAGFATVTASAPMEAACASKSTAKGSGTVGQSAIRLLKLSWPGVVLQLVDDREAAIVEHQNDQLFCVRTEE